MNRKNWIKFIARKNKENYFVFVIYTVIVAIFTYCYGITIGSISYEKAAGKLFKDCNNIYSFVPYTMEEGKELPKLDGIVYDPGVMTIDGLYGGKGERVLSSSREFCKVINWNLSDGTVFSDNKNEVIVFANSSYSVGDKLTLDGTENMDEYTVIGKVKDTIFFADNSGGYIQYTDNDDYDYAPPYEYLVTDIRKMYENGVIFLNPINEYALNCQHDEERYIFTGENSDIGCLSEYGDIESVEELKEDSDSSFWERDESILEICLLLIFLGGLILHNYLATMRRMREYGIYYMLGATWGRLIALVSLQKIYSFIIGFLLGSSFVYSAYKKIESVDILFLWGNQLAILVGMMIIYMLSVLPIIIRLKTMRPISLIRRRE